MYKTEKQRMYYDEVIRLHFEEGYGTDRIENILPIGHSTASRWINNFVAENGKEYPMKKKISPDTATNSASEVERLKNEIAILQGQLKYQQMRAEAYDTMIEIAEKKFKIEIRKKSGAKQ